MDQLLTTALDKGLISNHFNPFTPKGFPYHFAIVGVKLLDGCLPPPGAKARVGVGVGLTESDAQTRAYYEAAERFSLQFDPERQGTVPIYAKHGAFDQALTWASVSLGSPDPSVTSKGTAAGTCLSSALDRAVLEIIEHHALRNWASDVYQVSPIDMPDDHRVAQYLARRHRQIKAHIAHHKNGAFVAYVAISDNGGARLTTGTGSAWSVNQAIEKAMREAVFTWRNFIELERNGAEISEAAGDMVQAWRIYLGADEPAEMGRHVTAPLEWNRQSASEGSPLKPLALLSDLLGKSVAAADITSPQLGIPVVKVIV